LYVFVFEAMILQSPTSRQRLDGNKKNGVEQRTSCDSGDCEYLELQDSLPGDSTLKDYVNMPAAVSQKASTAENVTDVKSEERSSQMKHGTVGTASPTPSDSSDLPEYVNVQVSSYEPPPPLPPRKK
jgi:hypothetical protein